MAIANEAKYKIADAMARVHRNLVSIERNKAFGVIINANIRINSEMTTLKTRFSEKDACHITNLVLCKLHNEELAECDDLDLTEIPEEEEA